MISNYLWIKVECSNYYKLINKLTRLNINISKTNFKDNCIYLKIKASDISKIKKYLPYYSFKILGSSGIAKVINKIKSKFHIFICLFLGLICLYIFSNLIIEVEVIHSNQKIRKLVTNELIEQGIKPLTFRKNYNDLQKIKEQILNQNQDHLEWLEIERKGMKYVVRIEERILTIPDKKQNSCNIIAKTDGIIKNVYPVKGITLVSEGNYVSEGEILISGEITANDEIKKYVCAKGKVTAETWYNVKISLPLKYQEVITKDKYRYNIKIKNKKFSFKILRSKYQNTYDEDKKLFHFYNLKIYLTKEYDTIQKKGKYTEEEALKKAIILANEKMNIKKSEQDRIITQKVLKKNINNSTMNIEMFYAIEQDIGKTVLVEKENGVLYD